MVLLYTILILALFFLVINIIDINRFIVKEYKLESDKIDKELNIVLLSDLHNRQYGKDNCKLIAAINDLHPDITICAGDMLTAIPRKDNKRAVDFFKNYKNRPVFYGLGNHEHKMKLYTDEFGSQYEEYISKVIPEGINILENDHIDIEGSNIRIQGLMIERKYYVKFRHERLDAAHVRELTGDKDKSKYEILIAHDPEYFPAYAEAGADLVLSGHVHGGIMKLPVLGGVISPKLKLFPKFDGGLFTSGESTMVLSRGLGCHTLPVRIFNPGELVLIRLLPCQK